MKLLERLFWYREEVPFEDCNKYIIDGDFLILVDTGNPRFIDRLLKGIRNDGLDPSRIRLILNTHCHPDHCGANVEIKKLTGANVIVHPAELEYVEDYRWIGERIGVEVDVGADADWREVIFNGITLQLIHTPGHSPGSICVYSHEGKFLICGDLVFTGTIGTTELPGGDESMLKKSVEKISELEIEHLLPGHGAPLNGADKVARNFRLIKSLLNKQ
ncbi:MAG: MBL fold metallo-hydrolase [Thermoproteota archaeon]